MKAVKQHVHGKILRGSGSGGRTALLLLDADPEVETAESLYLRYAFVTLGPEVHIFPRFVLDDWGHEIRSLELYQWVREHGNAFPRAEIFGFERDGQPTQCFARELELYVKLPCYAFSTPDIPLTQGILISEILLPEPTAVHPAKIKRPSHLERPLRLARVNWWQVNPDVVDIDFRLPDE